jgi:antitoxin component YwqK of YwqJK toxin-antitoxin module
MQSVAPRRAVAGLVLFVSGAGCAASSRTFCVDDSALVRRYYSGGGAAEWCRRPDGVRNGAETRYYENGGELANGGYRDGALHGVWRYRWSDGRNWRAEQWDDGALVAKTIDPAVASLTAAQLAELGPHSSLVINLGAHDPGQDHPATPFYEAYANGRPHAAGQYDADGLRTGVWRFWFESGRPAREVEYWAGVREHAAREWHQNGALAAEGSYVSGERDGLWRWWDEQGRVVREIRYGAGAPAPSSR